VNDIDRWINLEGPEPPQIRELLDAAREVPELTPELSARLDRNFYAALAAQRRRHARERSRKVALGVGLFALGAAAALMLVLRWAAPGDRGLPPVPPTNTIKLETLPAAVPSVSATSGQPDAGAARRPGE
jgi:hypothetical protein